MRVYIAEKHSQIPDLPVGIETADDEILGVFYTLEDATKTNKADRDELIAEDSKVADSRDEVIDYIAESFDWTVKMYEVK